ncbi:hypothetical protein B4102_2541 [Heyndrickxia sporothermodurans]|uniref:Uncharacterized protein n=1 Tax=Heyndrickxia sporothermodurans TaxID=46224 RepID=A0A150LAI6_9BACI|nr:hypothetical protein B4102_2541 [Heyndrickxia sporothermodurans]
MIWTLYVYDVVLFSYDNKMMNNHLFSIIFGHVNLFFEK